MGSYYLSVSLRVTKYIGFEVNPIWIQILAQILTSSAALGKSLSIYLLICKNQVVSED